MCRTTESCLYVTEDREKRQGRVTLSVVDAVGAGESLIGVAFRLAGHRVQLVALAQQGHPVEVVAPEVLLGYTVESVSAIFPHNPRTIDRNNEGLDAE